MALATTDTQQSNSSSTSSRSATVKSLAHTATWPPLVYFLLGGVVLLFWAAGTAVQVQTSEAWIQGATITTFPSLHTFGQIIDFVRGALPGNDVVPFIFAWGVQLALILASVGVELPPHPKWRYYLSWGTVIALIGVNSAGDYNYSQAYGFWGALGFTSVILFLTFCAGLLAVVCFVHGFRRMMASA